MTNQRSRVAVRAVTPQVACGRFSAKTSIGERVRVEADVFTDGHDAVDAAVQFRHADRDEWREVAMRPLGNDRWSAEFEVDRLGHYVFTVRGWVDRFGTWRRDLVKRVDAGQDVAVDLLAGAELVEEAAKPATGTAADTLRRAGRLIGDDDLPQDQRVEAALDPTLQPLMRANLERRFATTFERELTVLVERERARFSAWYELFPRSASSEPGRHGTLRDVEQRLPYVADLGFDVLYLPPVHPIGTTHRKGPDNVEQAGPVDVGSPWAIGSSDGGHKSVHPELGTVDDVAHLAEACRNHGMELALDIAFQCSPDHPYVSEHPEWFRRRPDGTIQYAENPPKKYQDIYPLDFECDEWEALWDELRSVVEFWIDKGVSIFRVDNPHTKPFGFWEWLIDSVRRRHPDVIFLSEAFTRPKVMYELAQRGFSQSYTYFTWRNTADELRRYLTELTGTGVADFFRPNAWPNTPDILPEHLQYGGRPAFVSRLVLAATLCSNYGIYGPTFELQESEAVRDGSEEYRRSEKYQLRHWDLDRADSLREMIGRVNTIRRQNPALQHDRGLAFHPVDNPELLAYSKISPDGTNLVLVVVNVDPHWRQSGYVELDPERFGIEDDHPYQVHDLLGDGRYLWHGPRNFIELDPAVLPAHVFAVRRRVRSERDFDYYA